VRRSALLRWTTGLFALSSRTCTRSDDEAGDFFFNEAEAQGHLADAQALADGVGQMQVDDDQFEDAEEDGAEDEDVEDANGPSS
jgi:hypothetical protein